MHIQPFYYCEACKTEHLEPPADFHAAQALGAEHEHLWSNPMTRYRVNTYTRALDIVELQYCISCGITEEL